MLRWTRIYRAEAAFAEMGCQERGHARQFARAGTEELENPGVLKTPEVVAAGGLAALKVVGSASEILRATKERLFAS